jgi:hypothetical protein
MRVKFSTRTGFVRAAVVILVFAGFTAAAHAASSHAFRFSQTILSQCTGENTAVELDGTVTVDRRVAQGVVTYAADTALAGSATGLLTGTRIELVGDERIELADPGAGKKLVILDHLDSADAGPEAAPLGFATATLTIDGKGRVTNVATAFEFTCD